jgi:replicative DNA helicase
VFDELKKMGQDHECGGLEYLRKLLGSCVNPIFTQDHIETCLALQLSRKIIELNRKTIQDLTLSDRDSSRIIQEQMVALEKLKRTMGFENPIKSMFETMGELINDLDSPEIIYKTGFVDFDEYFHFSPGHFVVIGADTGCGKSAFVTQVMRRFAKDGVKCMMASMEMRKADIMKRLLSLDSLMSYSEIRKYKDTQEIYEAQQRLLQLPITFMERTKSQPLNIDTILDNAKRERDTNGLDVLIPDYLGLIPATGKHTGKYEAMCELTEKFKNFSKDENILVIALSQFSRTGTSTRQGNNPRPTLHDLKESGSIENDADSVLLLWKPSMYGKQTIKINNIEYETQVGDQDLIEIINPKQRHGRPGMCYPIRFEGKKMRFYEIDKNGGLY